MKAASADLERQMEATAEAVKISERGMKEAAKEAKVKAAAAKSNALFLFLVGVRTYKCKMF